MAKILQVTLGSGATQLAADLPFRQAMIQNNASHDMRVGDSTVDSSHGVVLLSSAHGSVNIGPFDAHADNLKNYYVSGTAADVVDIFYIP